MSKTAGQLANSADADQTSRSAASNLGLYCLPTPTCPNNKDIYGIIIQSYKFVKNFTHLTHWLSKHPVNVCSNHKTDF